MAGQDGGCEVTTVELIPDPEFDVSGSWFESTTYMVSPDPVPPVRIIYDGAAHFYGGRPTSPDAVYQTITVLVTVPQSTTSLQSSVGTHVVENFGGRANIDVSIGGILLYRPPLTGDALVDLRGRQVPFSITLSQTSGIPVSETIERASLLAVICE